MAGTCHAMLDSSTLQPSSIEPELISEDHLHWHLVLYEQAGIVDYWFFSLAAVFVGCDMNNSIPSRMMTPRKTECGSCSK